MKTGDNKAIENYLGGDRGVLNKLIKKYLKPVYDFTFQLVQDRSIAEDIVQETFVKAWKNLRRFDKSKNFKTWLFTIAKNTAFDYLKKKKAIPFSKFINEIGNNKLENIKDEELELEKILEQEEIAEKLEAKLEQIPEQYKIILLLHYKDNFSLQEIAEILGAPYNTVKSRHTRALQALKKEFLEK